jgi:hypothetical protein
LVDVLSALRFTYSDYPYGIFNLFLLYKNHLKKKTFVPNNHNNRIGVVGVRNGEYTPTIDS